MTDVTDKELLEALDRIARTSDGEALYLYLMRVVMEIPQQGALKAHSGRRSLAAELMGKMARGMDESSGRPADTSSDAGGPASSRRVVVFRSERASPGRRLSPRDWLAANDPELAVSAPRAGDD